MWCQSYFVQKIFSFFNFQGNCFYDELKDVRMLYGTTCVNVISIIFKNVGEKLFGIFFTKNVDLIQQ